MNAVLFDNCIVPDWPAPARVRALVTTRAGGASSGRYSSFNLGARVGDDTLAVRHNRALLRELLPGEPVWLRQAHGRRVIDAARAAREEEADGAVARRPGAVCVVLTADCLPVLLCDREGGAVGIAHAGWRGLAGGVIESVVGAMGTAPRRIIAWLGPGIAQDAYEVGRDVVDAFVAADANARRAFSERAGGKYGADLYALAGQRLEKCGVGEVYGGAFCTHRDSGRFFSHRRDGVTGRMANLIWLE